MSQHNLTRMMPSFLGLDSQLLHFIKASNGLNRLSACLTCSISSLYAAKSVYSKAQIVCCRNVQFRPMRVHNKLLHEACHSSKQAQPTSFERGMLDSIPTSEWMDEATLYVHWPYCQRRCTYCNFNKYIDKVVDHAKMQQCLVQEARTLIDQSGIKRIKSVFFGGGTPSLAKPQTLQAVLDTVSGLVDVSSNAEVTMEGNPTSVGRTKLQDFKLAGINRVSLGIQALNDNDLKLLGRDHTTSESLQCIEEARRVFPGRLSLDIIFGRPGQTLSSWEQELQQLLTICDNHLSLYQLTLERGTTLFEMHARGQVRLPSHDDVADMYTLAVDMMEEERLKRYEVSNFAKEGYECIHNQSYWAGGQYIGIGPGAHGRFIPQNCESVNECKSYSRDSFKTCIKPNHEYTTSRSEIKQGSNSMRYREARIQTLEPRSWMYEVLKYGHGTRKRVSQSQLDILQELLLVGMRTNLGVTCKRWAELSQGGYMSDVFCDDNVQRLVQAGLLVKDRIGLRATANGMALLDCIIPHLIVTLQDWYRENCDSD
ncbi:radical S-adenosyl methionine domain-containing protein 1, mitochondrial-like [Acanthaster planci]|uniref:Radical S-adenosyl methionine domain-containing protein 1, mitochondrial n=1 Tax=Acanthaster planci TaxID=133434 RepID=A0A8B7YLX9_ACAPL|nr:radical S-adenosyl methionine domain-containing protein 1, mitochondrial-like [Acanthaster planci]XP_022093577.1 radical S-adenosyl methionine domain-containing protein 1, mitochondrial-like [Acanthaster planci]XP_022093662.1 radical S-adenosyl methionine domain-containing protein 1, mitochondrial-like [Acanthaster planci]